MDPVVHFEMPAEDKKRASEFYAKVFGWKMQQLGPEMGDYLLANSTEVDEKTQRPKIPGAINGGFFQKGKEGTMPHLVISVQNLEKSIEKVKKAGGRIEKEPADIPGIGRFAMFTDTEKNRVCMLQLSQMN